MKNEIVDYVYTKDLIKGHRYFLDVDKEDSGVFAGISKSMNAVVFTHVHSEIYNNIEYFSDLKVHGSGFSIIKGHPFRWWIYDVNEAYVSRHQKNVPVKSIGSLFSKVSLKRLLNRIKP